MKLGRERGLSMGVVLRKPILTEILREQLSRLKCLSRQELSADLPRALADGQLYLEFQPKLDCRSSRFTSVEALVRWNHPERGIIAPTQFIPLAEEIGLISRITDWVIAAAANQAVCWRADQLALDVAVNVSARDVEDLSFPDRLERRCRDAGLDPSYMTIELTETGAMREVVQMMDVLTRLRLKGFKLSIDDFGMGYSSLVQLQRMPFSEIKIDRWFVMQMTSTYSCRVIVEIVIDLARKLGLNSVAEGVEDEAALNSVIEMGCDAVQGYHLCPPVSASRVAEFVRAHEAASA
jgi:EAL domain-containing protein (putative c-di-GMP-specific phosphodiesterase class I)